jgi:hypothetical protein
MPTYEIAGLTVNVDFKCHEYDDKGKITDVEIAYRARVEFESLEWLLEYGGESVTRVLQGWARKGKFPKGERVTVKAGEKVEFPRTLTRADIDRMSDEELEKAHALYLARMKAKTETVLPDDLAKLETEVKKAKK